MTPLVIDTWQALALYALSSFLLGGLVVGYIVFAMNDRIARSTALSIRNT